MATNKLKDAELLIVHNKYRELKTIRMALMQEYARMVEEQVQDAKEEFADYIQSLVDRDDNGYKITVSDLSRAMGTTNRNTIYEYLGDARERRDARIGQHLETGSVFEFTGDDLQFKDHTRYGVKELRSGNTWRVWAIGPEDDLWYFDSPWTIDHYSAKFNTYKPEDEYPAHVQWYIEQKKEEA